MLSAAKTTCHCMELETPPKSGFMEIVMDRDMDDKKEIK
jgi:hypothetical protein